MERYLDSQFYENVNSTSWRNHLRASHGFCHEHAWLGVNKRLGDALGFTIIYHDIVKNLLPLLSDEDSAARARRGRGSGLGQAQVEQGEGEARQNDGARAQKNICHRRELVG